MRNLNYHRLADELGIQLCAGGCSVSDFGHTIGVIRSGRLHWRPRRVRRSGLRRFLRGAYRMRFGDTTLPRWYQVWAEHRFAESYAHDHLHIRLDKTDADIDRAFVEAQLGTALATRTLTPIMRLALRWSRR